MNTTAEFCESLIDFCGQGTHVQFVATEHKGSISLIWHLDFPKQLTHEEAYSQYQDEIDWANKKLEAVKRKYPERFLKLRVIDMDVAKHFDNFYSSHKQPPAGKDVETNQYTLMSHLQLKRDI